MQRKKITPPEARPGDRVSIEMKQGADRDGIVSRNDPDNQKLEITGDNFVSISVSYSRIDKIEKLVN